MSAFSLDDAATLLLQLEPDDTTELARLRDGLADLALDNRVGIASQPMVARAVRLLGRLAAGADADGHADAATLAEVGTLLERAMAAEGASAATPGPIVLSPAAAPAAHAAHAGDAADAFPADVDAELLRDFLAESRECVAASEQALLALERAPDDHEAINTVFRAFHTVKGTSAFLGLDRLTAFAHEAESLLSRVRDHEIAYERRCADLALRSVDMLKSLLGAVDAALRAGAAVIALPDGYDDLAAAVAMYDAETVDPDEHDTPPATPAGAPTAASAGAPPQAHDAPGAAETPHPAAPRRADAPAERRASDRRSGEDRRSGVDRRAAADADATLRVRIDRLDRLVDLVGELVIAQSMIANDEHVAGGQRHELTKKVAHAGKIVRELQELGLGMRMVPLRGTFQKLTRVVRDVTAKNGRVVEFVTDGEDTEIDRTMVDVIGDPLVHMLRNALDHGVEPPDERERLGKPRAGRVRLAAYHAGGSVIVELQDDGRGLDRERILRKAVERGLVDGDRPMSDADVYNLIFAPGFSTAEQVTDISGRGVGMDVVRRNVESLRGRIDIASTPGQGTTFYVRVPLTLAVTDGMLVRVGAERYVVPTTNIQMSFRPEPAMLQRVAGRGEVVMLRGEIMPVVRLHRLFGVPGAVEDPTRALLMIVGDGNARRSALLVDELLGQQQVVAKPLGDGVGRVPGITGGAILGDGRVGLIVDVGEILALAQAGEAVPPGEATPSARAVA
jgi:two-component system chemotaxis sensor kinase CheA